MCRSSLSSLAQAEPPCLAHRLGSKFLGAIFLYTGGLRQVKLQPNWYGWLLACVNTEPPRFTKCWVCKALFSLCNKQDNIWTHVYLCAADSLLSSASHHCRRPLTILRAFVAGENLLKTGNMSLVPSLQKEADLGDIKACGKALSTEQRGNSFLQGIQDFSCGLQRRPKHAFANLGNMEEG